MNTLPRQTLVLFSGLPGCGKTTLAQFIARHFGIPLFAKDRFQRVLRDHVQSSTALDGYLLLLDQADEQLSLGLSVVVDAVFPKTGFREQAQAMAVKYGARFCPILCYCSDEHLWKTRMEDRVQYVTGWEPIGWEMMLPVRELFEEWDSDGLLHLDAVDPIAGNTKSLVDYLCQIDKKQG